MAPDKIHSFHLQLSRGRDSFTLSFVLLSSPAECYIRLLKFPVSSDLNNRLDFSVLLPSSQSCKKFCSPDQLKDLSGIMPGIVCHVPIWGVFYSGPVGSGDFSTMSMG